MFSIIIGVVKFVILLIAYHVYLRCMSKNNDVLLSTKFNGNTSNRLDFTTGWGHISFLINYYWLSIKFQF